MCNNCFRSFLVLAVLALSCVFSLAQSPETDGWQHVRDQDGVDLFFKSGDNGVRLYKAVATLNALLPEAAAQLMEIEQYAQWMEGFNQVQILGKERDGSTNLYMQVHTPSLAADRDVVANLIFSQTDDAVIGRFTNRPTLKPEVSGYLRVPVFSGFIIVRQTTDMACKFTMQCEIDLGGNLPEAVVDFQMKKFVAESVKAFSQEFQYPVVRGNE